MAGLGINYARETTVGEIIDDFMDKHKDPITCPLMRVRPGGKDDHRGYDVFIEDRSERVRSALQIVLGGEGNPALVHLGNDDGMLTKSHVSRGWEIGPRFLVGACREGEEGLADGDRNVLKQELIDNVFGEFVGQLRLIDCLTDLNHTFCRPIDLFVTVDSLGLSLRKEVVNSLNFSAEQVEGVNRRNAFVKNIEDVVSSLIDRYIFNHLVFQIEDEGGLSWIDANSEEWPILGLETNLGIVVSPQAEDRFGITCNLVLKDDFEVESLTGEIKWKE
jgi:hypothetical protein